MSSFKTKFVVGFKSGLMQMIETFKLSFDADFLAWGLFMEFFSNLLATLSGTSVKKFKLIIF
jgi:hypothetical protein